MPIWDLLGITDASTTGLGAVLYQHQDEQDLLVAYASHSLTTVLREALPCTQVGVPPAEVGRNRKVP